MGSVLSASWSDTKLDRQFKDCDCGAVVSGGEHIFQRYLYELKSTHRTPSLTKIIV